VAESVAVGDFNADRDPDLAVVNGASDDVLVLLGGASGAFGSATSFRAIDVQLSVAVGDFNRDGDPDLAVAGGNFGVSVLLNTTHTCGGRRATLVARPGSGPLRGTRRADVIVGSRRADVIDGRGGADRICGRGGDDRLAGEGGDDRLDGEAGRDRLAGGRGLDRLRGGRGDDRLRGGSGADRLDGRSGSDRHSGGRGDDFIATAGTRRDRVDCGPGRDRVRADRLDRVRRCERVRLRGGRRRH
jgi:Ca2+-binding RTX toxin-like protein